MYFRDLTSGAGRGTDVWSPGRAAPHKLRPSRRIDTVYTSGRGPVIADSEARPRTSGVLGAGGRIVSRRRLPLSGDGGSVFSPSGSLFATGGFVFDLARDSQRSFRLPLHRDAEAIAFEAERSVLIDVSTGVGRQSREYVARCYVATGRCERALAQRLPSDANFRLFPEFD